MTAMISKLQAHDINQPMCWKAKLSTLGKDRAREQNKNQPQARKKKLAFCLLLDHRMGLIVIRKCGTVRHFLMVEERVKSVGQRGKQKS